MTEPRGFIYFLAILSLVLAKNLAWAQSDSIYLKAIHFEGLNRTKRSILDREITLNIGQRYSQEQLAQGLERSRQNLMNLSLFNFVESQLITQADSAEIIYRCTERWYLWPSFIFEYVDPNFNTWYESKDWSRTNVGLLITQYNFRGRNESLRLRLKYGYNKQVQLSYSFPYINKAKTIGLAVYGDYTEHYQVNTASAENKRVFYTRIGEVAKKERSISSRLNYRPKLFSTHYAFLKFIDNQVQDSLALLFPDYFGKGLSKRRYLELAYSFVYDKTNLKAYPTNGKQFGFSVLKPDLYLDQRHKSQLWQASAYWRQFIQLGPNSFFAYGLSGKLSTFQNQPYAFQRGLGYNDFVRGYELFIFDAQKYFLFKSATKWRFLNNKGFKLNFIRNPRFNRVFFGGFLCFNLDGGYAHDKLYAMQNPLSNTLLLGSGLGIDLISFYDFVVRTEYSITRHRKQGFFLHFSKSI